MTDKSYFDYLIEIASMMEISKRLNNSILRI